MTDSALRPLLFARVQFDRDRDGCGEWVRGVFAAEQNALREDIAKATPEEIDELRQEAAWSIDILHEIDSDIAANGPTRRMRVYRGGQGFWIQGVLRDEQSALYDDLAALRVQGRLEDDAEVTAIRQRLLWSTNILRDLDASLVSLVGPDEDPRDR
jgi:hypothetical protein